MAAGDSGTGLAAAMFAADLASRGLGMDLLDVGDGTATVRMTVTRSMINGHGIAHGGYVFLLADTAFACACNSRGVVTVAAGADISFVTQVREGAVLVATATERATFGRSGIYDVTVRSGDQVVAEFRGRSRARSASSRSNLGSSRG
ncbi:MAG TPA: hydroxyphenylacetyl-CoA thioesterase PaaI [Streptosporangiaceae bacterium]|nr:hydroxyphenylacetyl-CoA thioesterase PaaI [Streptosporangiaceae bacterium]